MGAEVTSDPLFFNFISSHTDDLEEGDLGSDGGKRRTGIK